MTTQGTKELVRESDKSHTLGIQSRETRNPRPWHKTDRIIVDATGAPVTGLVPSRMQQEVEPMILRAVNGYDAMLDALEAVAEEWERLECPLDHLGPQAPDWIRRVKTALALAKGEQAE